MGRICYILLVAGEPAISPQNRNAALLWLGVILLIVIVGGAVLLMFRRRVKGEVAEDVSAEGGFLLSDLRKMRDEGEITAEEYERTRARVVEKVKAKANEPRKPRREPGAVGRGMMRGRGRRHIEGWDR